MKLRFMAMLSYYYHLYDFIFLFIVKIKYFNPKVSKNKYRNLGGNDNSGIPSRPIYYSKTQHGVEESCTLWNNCLVQWI